MTSSTAQFYLVLEHVIGLIIIGLAAGELILRNDIESARLLLGALGIVTVGLIATVFV